MREVWTFAEEREGVIRETSLELLSCGREIAEKLNCDLATVLLTDKGDNCAELISRGSDKVYLAEDPCLNLYQSDIYAEIVANLATKYEPEVFLFSHTGVGADLAASVAAKLKTGLSSHVFKLEVDEKGLICSVPGFGGDVFVIRSRTRLQMATIMRGSYKKAKKIEREGEIIPVEFGEHAQRSKILYRSETLRIIEEKESEPLESSEIVMGVGLGACKDEIFKSAEELATLLGASMGGSRPAVDEGFIEERFLIGQSGKIISPKIHIALGISGSIQYMMGVQNSEFILAVNKDRDAQIFKFCDIGIVGDLIDVLPRLIDEICENRRFSRLRMSHSQIKREEE
jgi:electron transfer flavoprotein alpha subunit